MDGRRASGRSRSSRCRSRPRRADRVDRAGSAWNARLQSAWFDAYQELWPRTVVSMPATIVEIDQKSLAHTWPMALAARPARRARHGHPALPARGHRRRHLHARDGRAVPRAPARARRHDGRRSSRVGSRRCRPTTRCLRDALGCRAHRAGDRRHARCHRHAAARAAVCRQRRDVGRGAHRSGFRRSSCITRACWGASISSTAPRRDAVSFRSNPSAG